MADDVNGGGPAFPVFVVAGGANPSDVVDAIRRAGATGVTLRDLFAISAMHGLIGDTPDMMKDIAESAYEQADAMLAAREPRRESFSMDQQEFDAACAAMVAETAAREVQP